MLETTVGYTREHASNAKARQAQQHWDLEQATERLLTMCKQPLMRHLAAGVLMAEEAAKAGNGYLEALLAGTAQETPDGLRPSHPFPSLACLLLAKC